MNLLPSRGKGDDAVEMETLRHCGTSRMTLLRGLRQVEGGREGAASEAMGAEWLGEGENAWDERD